MFRKSAAALLICIAVFMALVSHGAFAQDAQEPAGSTIENTESTGESVPGSSEAETDAPETVYADFSDVSDNDWFCSDVRTLAGMGVVNGYEDGTFKPEDNVTRAEFLKLLVSLLYGDSLFVTYDYMFEDVPPTEWYSTYIATAAVYGIIDLTEYGTHFEPDSPITRREVAKLIVNALSVEAGSFETPYADTADHNIICLYGLGLMQGTPDPETGRRYFYPDTEITRAEMSAVILRIYKLMLLGDEYIENFFKTYNLSPLKALYVPTGTDNFYSDITNAWDNNQAFLVYSIDDGTASAAEKASLAYTAAAQAYPEKAAYIAMDIGISENELLTLSFYSETEEYTYSELCENAQKAKSIAERIASENEFYGETDRQKAEAIYEYVKENIEYDFDFAPSSYTAYGALTTGKAVCQGYAGVFNLLCRASGIASKAAAKDGHMWNTVYAGGEVLTIDCTK